MKQRILFLFVLLTGTYGMAQTIQQKAIDISIGYGLSAPYDDVDVTGDGFYLQGEFVLVFNKWLDLRPYAGLILVKTFTGDDSISGPGFRSDAEAGLLGAKARFKAPIPWVSPYLEAGIGTSIGTFVTFTQFTDLRESGLLYHIPFSLGLELGPKHNFDFAFTYYFHPSVEQFAGAVAVGISIPLN